MSTNESKHFISAIYENKNWFYYINGIKTQFTPIDNDCIVAKIEENTNINSIKRIIRYYENQDSVFEALTEGGTIQGLYKKDGMLFINAEVVASGKLKSANGVSEFDLDNGTFRLGGTSSTDYAMKFDGTDLYFSNGAIKWENLDEVAQENLRNVTVSITGGVRSVVVNSNNEIQTSPTVYTAKVMLGTEDVTASCSLISWTASGIYTGNASGSTFIPSKGAYTLNESYIEVAATYKNKQFRERIGIAVSKQGATGAQGPQGQQGLQGIQGAKGEQGIPGADGKTTYFHIKYSSVSNPTSSSQMTETPNTYIGTYVDYTEADSTDPSKYTWSRFQGLQGATGEQGIPGVNGADGKTTYLHIKYSNDGGSTFTSNNGETVGAYIGTCTDFNQADPTTVSAYTWAKIKGEQGVPGVQGPAGSDGKTYYTWIKYANDSSGSGMSDLPDGKKYIGMAYNKTTSVESTNASDYTWSLIQGPQGVQGPAGSDGKTYYTWLKYADTPTSGMSDSPDGKKYMGLAYNKTTATESTNYSDYTWSLIKGEDGATGPQGPAGKSVTSVDVEYAIHTSATTAPTTGWQTTTPTWVDGKYIWSRTKTTYSSGNPTYTNPACITGGKGATGAAGNDGKGVKSTTITYQASTSGTTTPTGSWLSTIPTVSAGQYLWTRTVITYTDSTNSTSYSIGKMGEQGSTGAAGKGVKSTTVTYQASTSGTTTPTGSWSSTVPTVSAGKYLWTRTVITYTDNTSSTAYSIGKMGEQGPTGSTGATGTGVQSITELYKILDTKEQQPIPTSDTGWSTTPPTWSSGKYIHTCSKIVYSNPTSTVYTTPICDSSWEAVNEIEIGGRNLAQLTSSSYSNPYSNFTGVANTCPSLAKVLTTGLSVGDTVTVKLIYKYTDIVAASGQTASCWIQGSGDVTVWNSGAFNSSTKKTLSGSGEHIFLHSFKVTANHLKNTYWSVNIRHDYVQSGSVQWKMFKVEKGTKATDWTPAPEDVVSSVDAMYYLSTSSTSQAGGSWTKTLPSITANKFIWTKTVTTYAAGNTSETKPILYQPEWIQEWGGTKTTIASTSVLSPKIFAGTKESNGTATGVAMGVNIFGSGSNFSGLAGYKSGVKTYHFKTDGTFLIGKDTTGNHVSWDGATLNVQGNIKGSKIEGSTFISAKVLENGNDDILPGQIEDDLWAAGYGEKDVRLVNIKGAQLYSATKIDNVLNSVELNGSSIHLRNKIVTSMSTRSSTLITGSYFKISDMEHTAIEVTLNSEANEGFTAAFGGNVGVNGNVEIRTPGSNFIAPNNNGYMGKDSSGTAQYMLYMTSDNRISVGHNDRTVILNCENPVQRSNAKLYHESFPPERVRATYWTTDDMQYVGTQTYWGDGNKFRSVQIQGGNQIQSMYQYGAALQFGGTNATGQIYLPDNQNMHEMYFRSAWGGTNPAWKKVWHNYNLPQPMTIVYREGHAGIATTEGWDTGWVRTPQSGIIPYTAGGASKVGDPGWRFNYMYSVTNLNVSSDRNLKENIKYIKSEDLNPYALTDENLTLEDMYNFIKDDLGLATYNYKCDPKSSKLGFVAQDLLYNLDGTDSKVGQFIVDVEESVEEETYLSYDTGNYVSVIAGALKQAALKIEAQASEINDLKRENEQLKADILLIKEKLGIE